MDELKSCSCCGISLTPTDYKAVYSADVDIQGEQCTLCKACMHVIVWVSGKKRRPITENNPLTIEQIRQMDGQPVWCDWVGGWALVYIDGVSELNFVYCDGSSNTLSELRSCNINLLAYARKPEGNTL